MADERLRSLGRRALSPQDQAAVLRAWVRLGGLTQERVELAAYCGDPAARLVLGVGDSKHDMRKPHGPDGPGCWESAHAGWLPSDGPEHNPGALCLDRALDEWLSGFARWPRDVSVRASIAIGRKALATRRTPMRSSLEWTERHDTQMRATGFRLRAEVDGKGYGLEFYVSDREVTLNPDVARRQRTVAEEDFRREHGEPDMVPDWNYADETRRMTADLDDAQAWLDCPCDEHRNACGGEPNGPAWAVCACVLVYVSHLPRVKWDHLLPEAARSTAPLLGGEDAVRRVVQEALVAWALS